MNDAAHGPESGDASYWHQRVRAEANAALACDDARIAAIHVELATHCLRMAAECAPALEDAARG